jgi:dipeptidyl aminopeptidase/acylaminoacyl peptidase
MSGRLVQKSRGLIALTALCALSPVLAAASVEPYPVEYFALREVVNHVQVSPDGKRVGMLKILQKAGDPALHVYQTDELDGKPFVVDADPMEIASFEWVSDRHILLILRQKVRDMIEGQNQGVFEERIAILDLKEREFNALDDEMPDAVVENVLPNDPNKIIVSMQPGLDDDPGYLSTFRPRAYYKVDLNRGTRELLIRGKVDLGQIEFDPDGNPLIARGFDVGAGDYVVYYRPPGSGGWKEILRRSEDDFRLWMEDPLVLAPDPAAPGNVLVKAFNGDDKLGLWSLNTGTGSFDELLYRRSDVDIYGVRYHSNTWEHPDEVTAVSYFKDRFHFNYFDEVEEAAFSQLEQAIPNAYHVSVTSRSRDGNSLVALNVGPKDPGSYYLLHDGSLVNVGSRAPQLEAEKLADLRYFTYESRDGKALAGFLTVPKGEPPFPTVVMPHGGPHVLEVVLFDEWAQLLANYGYLVVQPQYRMSHGYGFEHFHSAFRDGSQAGRKMQDDKDDAVAHLVEEGLTDAERVAMFGWSYGGYSALVAASRSPQLYQCVIAGAAVSDYVRQANEYGPRARGSSKQWRENYEYEAVQPVQEVAKVNVPILLVHGSVDQRVRPRQVRMYIDALKENGKTYKYVELEGADHFYDTLFYEHQLKLYENLIGFLQSDCGPDGL